MNRITGEYLEVVLGIAILTISLFEILKKKLSLILAANYLIISTSTDNWHVKSFSFICIIDVHV